mgnify:FL=1
MASSAMSGFVKGFANGFVNERNRRLQEEKETNQMTLQYRLKDLSDQRDRARAQREKDAEIIKQAKNFGDLIGDPSIAPTAAKWFQGGGTQDGLLQEIQPGGSLYKKPQEGITVERRNPELDTNKGIKIPPVVANTVPVAEVPADFQGAEFTPTPDQQKTIDLGKKNTTAWDPKTNEIPVDDAFSKADEKIRTFAPQLLEKQAEPDFEKITENSEWGWRPKTVKEKFPSLAEAADNRLKAIESGDQAALAVADRQLKALSYAINLQRPEKEGMHRYAVLDNKNRFVRYITGTPEIEPDNKRQVRDVDTGKYVNGTVKYIDPEDYKQIGPVTEALAKKTTDIIVKRANFVTAADTGAKMIALSSKFDLAATRVGSMTAGVKSLLEEAKAGLTLISGEGEQFFESIEGRQKSLDDAVAKGDYESLKTQAQDMRKAVDKLMSQGIKDQAQAAVLYETYKTSLVYALAASKGETGNGLSQKDVENFRNQISGTSPETIEAQISAALSSNFRGLKAEANGINSEGSMGVKILQDKLGFDLGLGVKRMGKFIEEQYTDDNGQLSPDGQAVMRLFNKIENQSNPLPDSTFTPEDKAQQTQQTQQYKPDEIQEFDLGDGTMGNFRYKGGNPKDKNSWEQVK